MRLFSFSLLIGSFAVLAHLYLYRRISRILALGTLGRRGLAAGLAALALLLLLRRAFRGAGPDVDRAMSVVANSWLALALCVTVALGVWDLSALTVRGMHWLSERLGNRRAVPDEAPMPETRTATDVEASPLGRRQFVSRSLQLGVLAGGGFTAAYGAYRAFAPPEVTELAVRLPRLPKNLDGLTLMQLTDIHVGPFIDRSFLEQLVEMTNAERPDLVAITGDLVDGSVPLLGEAVATLGRLRSRYGTFFVTGNHEYYSGDAPWCTFLERIGITVLRNRRVSIGDPGGSLDLVGVDDWSGSWRRGRGGYDIERAIAGRDSSRAAVLLAHQPSNFDHAASLGMGLQLSGHTHGGQIFPMTELVGLRWKYSRGLYRAGESHIYVSRGCGFWGPPARIGSPPEIVKMHLTA